MAAYLVGAVPYGEGVGTDRALAGLDQQQRAAVMSDAAPLAIVAAAGSGKTRVLTRRIARRLADGSADARHVLAITFTRDAAGELRKRLRRLDIAEPIETGTFHAIALRLLRDRAIANDTAAPAVANDRFRLAREAISDAHMRFDAAGALADLDWARARRVHRNDFSSANREVRRKPNLNPDQFAKFVAAYDTVKRRRGVVDFDDLLEHLLAAMVNDPQFAAAVQWRFRHLFVDEAQDLNPLQFALLDQWRGGRPDICLVGDPRQAIYGWNGADPTLLDSIEQHLPGITILRLTGNYRCSPQVVRAGSAALSTIAMPDDTHSLRDEGAQVTVRVCADEHAEATQVAAQVRTWCGRYGANQVAVLARTNDQLAPLAQALDAAGIAIDRAAGMSHLDRCIADAARCSGREQLAAWVETVWADDAADVVRRRVAEEVDRYLSSGDPGGWRAWVEARQPFDDLDIDDRAGSVSLLTFHAAKGREWSAVVVAGVEHGLVPHASAVSVAQRQEEARLLHVAVTRAADELMLTAAEGRSGRASAPSPWLEVLRNTIEQRTVVGPPSAVRPARTVDPLAALRTWRAEVARSAGVAEDAICSTTVLRSLLANPPLDTPMLAQRLGLSEPAAERLAPRLFAVLSVDVAAISR